MRTKKSANDKARNAMLKSKGQAVSCRKMMHPDVILDADEALCDILGRLTRLEKEVAPIKAENRELKRRNEYLERQHNENLAVIRRQKAEISALKTHFEKLERPKKDSHNSSIPSSREDVFSSEERKRTRSLRKPSGKKTGGQPGHKGSTLQRKETVDDFVEIPLDKCPDCGKDLSGVCGTREISFPTSVVTQYSIWEKVCPYCGHTVRSEFPEGVNGEVFYGPNVQALVVYLCEEHAVSYQRIRRLLNDMFHIEMSEGTINNIVQKTTRRARNLYERIKSRIGQSAIVEADETGIDIAGILHWL